MFIDIHESVPQISRDVHVYFSQCSINKSQAHIYSYSSHRHTLTWCQKFEILFMRTNPAFNLNFKNKRSPSKVRFLLQKAVETHRQPSELVKSTFSKRSRSPSPTSIVRQQNLPKKPDFRIKKSGFTSFSKLVKSRQNSSEAVESCQNARRSPKKVRFFTSKSGFTSLSKLVKSFKLQVSWSLE